MSPSVDFDASPLWTADGKSLVFVRRPGLPFGQQAQQGGGGIGNPERSGVPAECGRRAGAARGRGGRAAARSRRRARKDDGAAGSAGRRPPSPGLMQATFKGGYTLSVWKADVATGEAQEVWHNEPNDRMFTTLDQPAVWRATRSCSR